MGTKNNPVLYFDGVCNLCNNSVQFVIRHDKTNRFLFASLQSAAGRKVTDNIKAEQGVTPDSLILFYNGRYYFKSDAAMQTAKLLGGAWKLFVMLVIVPRFIRNIVYDKIAKNRYIWFGRRDECMIPTPALKKRFLE